MAIKQALPALLEKRLIRFYTSRRKTTTKDKKNTLFQWTNTNLSKRHLEKVVLEKKKKENVRWELYVGSSLECFF